MSRRRDIRWAAGFVAPGKNGVGAQSAVGVFTNAPGDNDHKYWGVTLLFSSYRCLSPLFFIAGGHFSRNCFIVLRLARKREFALFQAALARELHR